MAKTQDTEIKSLQNARREGQSLVTASIVSNDMQRYICPECGHGGAHWKDSPAPLCHICDYKVTMKKAHNNRILEDQDDNI